MKAKEGDKKEADKKEAFPPAKDGDEKKPAADSKAPEKDKPSDSPPDNAAGGEKKHDDVDADKQLICDMLSKHLGDGDDQTEAYTHAKEVYEAYREMGHEPKEAIGKTEAYIEYAKHMAKKEAAKTEAAPPAMESKKESDVKEAAKEDKDKDKECKESQDASASKEAAMEGHKKMESAELLRLKGENAKLRESIATQDLESHIESTLAQSGLKREVTKLFRESVSGVKSKDDFNKNWKVFLEGYNSGKTSGSDVELAIPLMTEKRTSTSSEGSILDGCFK